jgi:N-acetylglucosamine-6-phosphate deacetylase
MITFAALYGARIFDGERFFEGHAVLVRGKVVEAIIPNDQIPGEAKRYDLQGGLLAPGFIDVQVNGGGGHLFNNSPKAETVQAIALAHRQHGGTVALLPTVITDVPVVLDHALQAVREARAGGAASIVGLHVEGPFLDPDKKGAHDARFMRDLGSEDFERLSNHGCGSLMLTVAPNIVSHVQVKQLAEAGIIVSLGHSSARFEQAMAAFEAGATATTHLFNAMSQLTGREPGLVGAALCHPASFIGVIADGHHVHPRALQLAFQAAGYDRFMLVSDAMSPAASGPSEFQLQGRRVVRNGSRLQLEDGTLAGSCLTMNEAVRYCVSVVGVPLERALQMASRNPARFLGRNDLGVLRRGALASMVHLGEQFDIRQTWIEGRSK